MVEIKATTHIYPKVRPRLLAGDVRLRDGEIWVMLLDSNYIRSEEHEFLTDVMGFEIKSLGYTAGGMELENKSFTLGERREGIFRADDAIWHASFITARYAVVYNRRGFLSQSELIHCVDFGRERVSDGGNFEILWSELGVIDQN